MVVIVHEQPAVAHIPDQHHDHHVHDHKAGVTNVKDLIAGAVGGVFVVLVGHPFDTVKVRLQTQGTAKVFNGPIDCAVKTLRNEGPLGFYKGLSAPLLCSSIVDAIYFTVNAHAKRTFQESPTKPMPLPYYFMSGALAGGLTSVIATPADLVKSRLQIQYRQAAHEPKLYKGPLHCIYLTVTKEGLGGMYKGLGATIMRDTGSIGTYFGTYEICRRLLSGGARPDKEYSMGTMFVSGGIAGVVAWGVTYPADVVKSKMQTQALGQSESVWKFFSKVLQTEGIPGFYRGFLPCVIRAFPANALCFLGFETTRRLLN